ncbi:MAG: LON peptidase substrate-binding domain-containing protein [Holosporales bacterium]|jgi:Lon protease-like protein|nr:LON peptidase substrate-binding domain-containing protein [Holosporales bacterium]
MLFDSLGIENEQLPKVLTLLPLRGVILVPRSELRLPVTDFSHLSSITDAVQGDNYVGVVQFRGESDSPEDDVFRCGCVGRVFDVRGDEEGHLMYSIRGICRFEITHELPSEGLSRRASVSYDKYQADIVQEADFSCDRERLIHALKVYFERMKIGTNLDELMEMSNEKLITMLMTICPFDAHEKQALLEREHYAAQSTLITHLMELDSFMRDSMSYH